jgi:hypothetical protein
MEHKLTAFHSMLHWDVTFPFQEVANIKKTAGLNGYTETTIDGLMSKHFF